jgi:hypothetical protein
VAWVSPNSFDSWFAITGKHLPSYDVATGQSKQGFASLWNTNVALDVHMFGRASVGVAAYDQNIDYGFFGQVLLLQDKVGTPLPGVAIGVRNVGPGKHEDRFFVAHDVSLVNGKYVKFVDPRYSDFSTAPTVYGVLTKQFSIGATNGRLQGSQFGFTLGYGNGLFSEDGGLGDAYNDKGTIAKGLFLGGRFSMHPSLNTSLDFMVENDGFDYNAGVVYDWRGLSAGLYGTELEEGGKKNTGFGLYNYTKYNVSLGYSGNIIDISRGVLLRTRITELTREQQRLTAEITARNRRIQGLEIALRKAQAGELAGMAARRAELEKSVQEERDAIQRAEERLRNIQQNPSAPTTPPASSTPPQN